MADCVIRELGDEHVTFYILRSFSDTYSLHQFIPSHLGNDERTASKFDVFLSPLLYLYIDSNVSYW